MLVVAFQTNNHFLWGNEMRISTYKTTNVYFSEVDTQNKTVFLLLPYLLSLALFLFYNGKLLANEPSSNNNNNSSSTEKSSKNTGNSIQKDAPPNDPNGIHKNREKEIIGHSPGAVGVQETNESYSTSTGTSANTNAQNIKNEDLDTIVIVLTNPQKSKESGCWAIIYDGKNFKGRSLTLVDGVTLPHLEFPAFDDWEGDIDSVEVGPNATLYLYGSENYEDLDQTVQANQKISDIDHKPAIDAIESARLVCSTP